MSYNIHGSLQERALYGIPIQSQSSSSRTSESSVGTTTVLIPLVISVVLIAMGIGLGLFCFVGYRRRQRVWWREFERGRGLRDKEEEVDGGPGMWEVEVWDGDDKGPLGDDTQGTRKGDLGVWSGTPVAVTYRRGSFYTPSPSFQSLAKSTSSSSSSTSIPISTAVEPDRVEMTFLIAMPSTSSPARSKRTSATSSLSSLSIASSSSSSSPKSLSSRTGSSCAGDEIPDVELATTIMPLCKDH